MKKKEKVVSLGTAALVVRTADFQVGCIAGFQARRLSAFDWSADLEIGATKNAF